jgi:hypothetical protein
MASGVPFTRTAAFVLLLAVTAASAMPPAPAPQVFVVGGEARGWRKPETTDETYNHWAARNRFRVGDFLCKKASNQSHSSHRHRISVDPLLLVHMQPNELNAADFKYDKANDSVLLVSRDDYKLCAAAKPTQRFEGGDTRFRLDHSGLFYFLSGALGHCDAGQRMAVRVMAPHPRGHPPPCRPATGSSRAGPSRHPQAARPCRSRSRRLRRRRGAAASTPRAAAALLPSVRSPCLLVTTTTSSSSPGQFCCSGASLAHWNKSW